MKKSLLWMLSIIVILICCGCNNSVSAESEKESPLPEKEDIISSDSVPLTESESPEDIISEATLLAVGDNLIHDVICYQASRRTDDGSYDFLPVYEQIRELIAAADIAYINQETPIAKSMEPSSYRIGF